MRAPHRELRVAVERDHEPYPQEALGLADVQGKARLGVATEQTIELL